MQILMIIWHWEWYDRLTRLIMIFLQWWWGQWQVKQMIYKWKLSCHSVLLGWKWHISLSVMEFTRIPQRTHCGLLQTVSPQSHTTIMCKCQCQTHNSQISNKLSHCAVFSNCMLQLHVTVMHLQWKYTQGKAPKKFKSGNMKLVFLLKHLHDLINKKHYCLCCNVVSRPSPWP